MENSSYQRHVLNFELMMKINFTVASSEDVQKFLSGKKILKDERKTQKSSEKLDTNIG